MRIVTAALALAVGSSTLSGQEEPSVGPGSRIRVRSFDAAGFLDRGLEGRLERVSGDTLVLTPRAGGPARSILASSEMQLFVFAGKRSLLLRGAAIGGMSGALAGGFVGMVAGRVCTTDDPQCPIRHRITAKASLILGASGMAAGLLIGAIASREYWVRSRDYWPSPSLSVGAEGVALGVALAF